MTTVDSGSLDDQQHISSLRGHGQVFVVVQLNVLVHGHVLSCRNRDSPS